MRREGVLLLLYLVWEVEEERVAGVVALYNVHSHARKDAGRVVALLLPPHLGAPLATVAAQVGPKVVATTDLVSEVIFAYCSKESGV